MTHAMTLRSAERRGIRALVALAVALAASLFFATAAFAADPYTYSVTLYAGNRGVVGSGAVSAVDATGTPVGTVSVSDKNDKVTISGLKFGDRVAFDMGGVTVADGKYYVRGVRMGGIDNYDADNPVTSSFVVTEDRDFVVAYGIAGNLVQYTVNYVDASGNQLAPSRTYYGNVGDQPVVAYLYIDGYQPQAYNLTKTLVADESQNVLTFTYSPGAALTVDAGTGTTTDGGTVNTGTTGTTGTAGTGTTTGTGTTAGGTADTADGTGTTAEGADTEGDATSAEPQELVNIDDDGTALANGTDAGGGNEDKNAAIGLAVAGVVALLIAAAVIVFLVLFYRKRRRDEANA